MVSGLKARQKCADTVQLMPINKALCALTDAHKALVRRPYFITEARRRFRPDASSPLYVNISDILRCMTDNVISTTSLPANKGIKMQTHKGTENIHLFPSAPAPPPRPTRVETVALSFRQRFDANKLRGGCVERERSGVPFRPRSTSESGSIRSRCVETKSNRNARSRTSPHFSRSCGVAVAGGRDDTRARPRANTEAPPAHPARGQRARCK
ncbi:hypothetical protein EVAR_66878_1 [Eumeta japonica]|uniref:Uncharacterized protein n=1 Tax=Eumeta variegata TaxID=151549 RepID=A0A4C2A1Z5_EUMVA|nr:hypothetical protein EVAR_66878_1 [Eumeta japonica]